MSLSEERSRSKGSLIFISFSEDLEDPSNYRIIIQALQPNGIPITKEGQEIIESVLGDAKLLILDNLSFPVRRIQEIESNS